MAKFELEGKLEDYYKAIYDDLEEKAERVLKLFEQIEGDKKIDGENND